VQEDEATHTRRVLTLWLKEENRLLTRRKVIELGMCGRRRMETGEKR
jgi:hypothetical protein